MPQEAAGWDRNQMAARAAQESFDCGLDLAHVPVERVLEMGAESHGLRAPNGGVPMLSYLDVGLLSPGVIAVPSAHVAPLRMVKE